MTLNKITKEKEKAMAKAAVKFDVAAKIREVLDAARKEYGPTDWDDEDMENEVLELVTEE